MAPPNPWPRLLRINGFLIGGAVLLGWLSGHLLVTVLVVALVMLGWNLRNLARLEHWLRLGRKMEPPVSRGIWGEVFDGLYRRHKRQRERYKKLRNLLRRYRESAKAMPDATVVLKQDYRIEWWNDAASVLLGMRWPADEGQRITNIYRHPEFVRFVDEKQWESGGVTLDSPVNGRVRLEIRLVPYGRKQYLMLARDVTRVERLETMRQDFVANVSHELRTPLTVIYGVAESLDEAAEDYPELRGSTRLLGEQVERMKLLVDDLLLLSRLETRERSELSEESVELPRMLESVIRDARVLSGDEGHAITLRVEPGWMLTGVAEELRSAFANLVTNAVKYTPAGGSIRVEWTVGNDGGVFAVTDDGPGIARHHLERLTERFYRVDEGRSAERGGTGLGLAIVKHVMKRNQGELRIDSVPGRGSTFSCHFPAERLVSILDDEGGKE